MNKESVINSLTSIINELKSEDYHISVLYRGEKSHLIRAGRNQISLNVGEEGSKYFVDIQKGKRFINGSLTAKDDDPNTVISYIKLLAQKIDLMPEVPHLKEASSQAQDIHLEEADPALKSFDSSIAINFYKQALEHFKEHDIELSGAFSAGYHNYAIASTNSPTPSYYEGTDFNTELVLQMLKDDKKELRVSQVGASLNDYRPEKMYEHLDKIIKVKKETKRIDMDPGEYDVVFHADAFAEMIAYMTWVALRGDSWLYQTGMLQEGKHDPGKQVFGKNFHLSDDPHDKDVLFHRPFGMNGIEKPSFTPFDSGILSGFYHTNKDTCDKFDVDINNCAQVASYKLHPGDGAASFEDMIKSSKTPTLYIPFIHYMNFTNPAKGEFTGTSRFGTFLMEDGELKNHIYNLRINDSFHHIFNNIDWLSSKIEHVNLSNTYGLRLAGALACPRYVKVKGVKVSGSSGTSKS